MANRYYTVKELAEALDVDVSSVYRWARDGVIETYRVGPALIRIPEEEFDRLTTRPVRDASQA